MRWISFSFLNFFSSLIFNLEFCYNERDREIKLRVAMEHRSSSFGFGDFGVRIKLKNKRRKLNSKLVGLGEVGVVDAWP